VSRLDKYMSVTVQAATTAAPIGARRRPAALIRVENISLRYKK
jgi:hypothetical protein